MLDFYNAYKEKIIQFILYRFQRLLGIKLLFLIIIILSLNGIIRFN